MVRRMHYIQHDIALCNTTSYDTIMETVITHMKFGHWTRTDRARHNIDIVKFCHITIFNICKRLCVSLNHRLSSLYNFFIVEEKSNETFMLFISSFMSIMKSNHNLLGKWKH